MSPPAPTRIERRDGSAYTRDMTVGIPVRHTGTSRRPGLSCVIPCFNEEEVLGTMLERLVPVCEASFGDDFELVLVNDGSRDGTWDLMSRAADNDSRIVAVDLSRNHGHQLALSAGLGLCRGEVVLVLDADLQDPPELLPKMLLKLEEGNDVVFGQRTVRRGESTYKRATAAMFYRLINMLSDVPIPVDAGDFRLMRRPVVDALNSMPETHRFVRGLTAWLGFRQTALAYERDPRAAGDTKYPTARMLRLAIDAITGFSVRPLRLSLYLGVFMAFASVALIAYAIAGLFLEGTVPGWMSLMCTVLVLGATQLVMLGIIGEYLGRIFVESKRRPLYIVREIHTAPAPAGSYSEPRDAKLGSVPPEPAAENSGT